MRQKKGIAIRIDKDLLDEIDNHNLPRNDLVSKAIEAYIHQTEKSENSPVKNKKKPISSWAEVNENSKKLKNITDKTVQKHKKPAENITDDLYNEIYSTLYNIEVLPLKKQLELKDELIETLQRQNNALQQDKQFLFSHIEKLEIHIPKKKTRFKKHKR
ncbi:MAG: hypothetical protein QCI00_08985 [Candidatus Thermoplasmatota archaeon]|nr:hypothetical protein [Candidatus Thermoplasmatota archaeon]